MSIYSKAIVEFEALNSQTKKEKLLSLLEKFRNLDEIFVKLINSISTRNYTDRVLNLTYKAVVSSMEHVEKMDLQKWLDQLNDLFSVLERIREAEELDRQQEWDPELWLEQVLYNKY